MPATPPITQISGNPVDYHHSWVAGAAAGDIAVAGIKKTDQLRSVWALDTSNVTPAAVDRTAEFTITADGTINNTGGTSTANKLLAVAWASRNVRL